MPNKILKKEEGGADAPARAVEGARAHPHWLMLACCASVLVAVGLLVATGVLSAFVLAALACVALMGAMVFFMMR